MSQPKLRALQTLLEQFSGADELRVARTENRQLRRALERIAAIATEACGARQSSTKKGGRRPTLADGSLHERLVTAAKEPQSLPQLIDAGGARKGDVKNAVHELERQGWVRRVGNGRWTKYQAVA